MRWHPLTFAHVCQLLVLALFPSSALLVLIAAFLISQKSETDNQMKAPLYR